MFIRLLKSLMGVNISEHYYIHFLPVQMSLSFVSRISVETAKFSPRDSGGFKTPGGSLTNI